MSEELLQKETMADYEAHFDDASPWNMVVSYMEKGTVLPVKVEGIVNGGAISTVEGLRGFIPASQLSLSYVENLEEFLDKEINVQVIEADQANNRLILSARQILREQARQAKEALYASVKVDSVVSGKVESIQSYGAFIRLENGLSGLVHISQVSDKRIKAVGDVLHVDDEVTAKVIGVNNGKISLSIKALLAKPVEVKAEKPVEEVIDYKLPKSENIGTSLADLFKNIKL